jgi:hydroxymethylpyrimidine/phosphomethylpyrimidine kinase
MNKIDRSRRGKTKASETAGRGKQFNRDTVLADLHAMLEDMAVKVVKGRIRDKPAFDLKLRALKAFAYSASVFSSVLDASENEAMISRLNALEDRLGGSENHDKGEIEE